MESSHEIKLEKYMQFLQSKMVIAPISGFDIEIPLIKFNDGTVLKPHQRDGIIWAIKGGRRALFESFGLGKTIQQLIICNEITKSIGGRALIVAPLGVRQEFKRDAKNKLGIDIMYIRNSNELFEGIKSGQKIFITNYERVRDGDISPKDFQITSLDEASVLRSYGSKTYQTFLNKFKGVKYKFVCTATPSPNKYKELIHYAGYLEIMDTGQALTRFFQRDSTKANNLTIYPHKEKEFWYWMSSWALFVTKPSDLGYDNTGYDMPEMKIIYHPVKVNHGLAGFDDDGQGKLFREAALGLKAAAKEKRDSMSDRILKMKEIIDNDPDSNYLIWHDLENERHEVMKILKGYDIADVYGTLDYDIREQRIIDFSEGKFKYLATKPSVSGQGCNFQYHCHKAIFLGIGYEFNDFIQAIHRIFRFMQYEHVEIHIIYAESEGEILKSLQRKWKQHEHLVKEMTNIIKEHGLSITNISEKMKRSIGITRKEFKSELYEVVHNDCVAETISMPDNSIDLVITSIPFANHYEYTPSYNDFGHTSGNHHFWAQMDFLTPELLRVVKHGRLVCIHVKDRVMFGNATGDGMPTLDSFHEETSLHFQKHGFRKIAMITIETDVVRENNQTYRLGWTEQTKDGSKMGVGCPEYVLVFRKLPTDTSKAYADIPVIKTKQDYPRGKWQIDARAKWNSSGDRFLSPDEIKGLEIDRINKYFSGYMQNHIYNYDEHVEIAVGMEKTGKLPATFETLRVPARYEYVWGDVNRMLTLNGEQSRKKLQMHVCPLQFDIVDRLIDRYSNKGDLVYDPFGGLMTTPVRAMKMGRIGKGCELNPEYFKDGLSYCRNMELNVKSPSLFDVAKINEHVNA
jgi:DNA modification methylase